MQFNGIAFGNCFDASGLRGFFVEGYWFHRWFRRLFGLCFNGSTFVMKTFTAYEQKGNLPWKADFSPAERFPRCIKVNPFRRMVGNAVALSGPGLEPLLNTGRLQALTEPFMFSFMAVGHTAQARMDETKAMVQILGPRLNEFRAKEKAMQTNWSCPNVKHILAELIREWEQMLKISRELGVPLVPKISITTPIEAVMELQQNTNCAGLCVSNTVPWDCPIIDVPALWGKKISPFMRKFGVGGGFTGAFLLDYVCNYIVRLRNAGFTKPIIGGGGILNWRGVDRIHAAGASSVSVGASAVFLAPWNVTSIIKRANALKWR